MSQGSPNIKTVQNGPSRLLLLGGSRIDQTNCKHLFQKVFRHSFKYILLLPSEAPKRNMTRNSICGLLFKNPDMDWLRQKSGDVKRKEEVRLV